MDRYSQRFSIRNTFERGLLLGIILVIALVGFEMFNFSTTEVALKDVLGSIEFGGIQWATILSIAFCGIDFAGIARLFLPAEDIKASSETWYLMGAWLLAASMNAILTWWGISLGLVNRSLTSSAFIAPATLIDVVPVFIALMVWLTRILLIGSFSIAGNHMFTTTNTNAQERPASRVTTRSTSPQLDSLHSIPLANQTHTSARPRPSSTPSSRPVLKPRPEPEYVPEGSYASSGGYSSRQSGADSKNTQQFL